MWQGGIFSLTRYHPRLSACCETKRRVGTRLGQGVFQLVRVEQAEPCVRWARDTWRFIHVLYTRVIHTCDIHV